MLIQELRQRLQKRRGNLPLYRQLKEELRFAMQQGRLPLGMRLPPERELAQELGLSRATVSQAYGELQEEGFLYSQRGRGTFVAREVQPEPGAVEANLSRLVDRAIDEAVSRGLSLQDLEILASQRIAERQNRQRPLEAAFVTRCPEYAFYFRAEVQKRIGLRVWPVVFPGQRRLDGEQQKILSSADLVITPFQYLSQVKEAWPAQQQPVLGISFNLEMPSVVALARLPEGHRVGLVSASAEFAQEFSQWLKDNGLMHFHLAATQSRQREALASFVFQMRTVAVTRDRREEVLELLEPETQECVELEYRPDLGSLNLLQSTVLELTNRRYRERAF